MFLLPSIKSECHWTEFLNLFIRVLMYRSGVRTHNGGIFLKLLRVSSKCGMLENFCLRICILDGCDLVHTNMRICQHSFPNRHQLGRVYSLQIRSYEQFLWKFERKTFLYDISTTFNNLM